MFLGGNESGALNGFYRFLVKAEARALYYFDIDRPASFVDGHTQKDLAFFLQSLRSGRISRHLLTLKTGTIGRTKLSFKRTAA